MALVTCSDCGQKISDQADACPRCGRLRDVTLLRLFGRTILGITILIVLAIF